jgi:hypothetical protein
MGIIDIHTHLTARGDIHDERNVPFLEMGGTKLEARLPVDHLLREMDRGGIEISVVLGSPANSAITTDYEALSRAIRPHRDRLIPFACLDPHTEEDPSSTVHRFIEDLGYRGIGEWGYFDYTDPICAPVYEACLALDVPILIHTGVTLPTTSLRWGWPILIDEVAIRYPALKIIAAHCGSPWCNEMVAVALRQPNVWIDISALFAFPFVARVQALVTMIAAGLGDRLLFGSDFPVASPADWARWVHSFHIPWPIGKLLELPPFGPRERAAMMEGNARRLLGL